VALCVASLGCSRARIDERKVAIDAEAREAVATVRFDDEGSIDRVAAIRRTPQGLRAANEALAAGAQGPSRWAAVWICVSSRATSARLREWLDDGDASIRAMAGAALVARGEPAGLEALVRLLSVAEPLRGSRPVVSVGRYANATLARFTGEDEKTAWSAWLEKNRGSVRFDADLGTWAVP
jgi:hypothetical protein